MDPSHTSSIEIAKFYYYSHDMRLMRCTDCELWWVDSHLDSGTIQRHFERTYKDETYFAVRREPIFRQVSRIVCDRAPQNGSVLDVGGAKGHLMQMVHRERPDLDLTLTDLSVDSCHHVESALGFRAICTSVANLRFHLDTYDVVVCSDVLYLEPDVAASFDAIRLLVKPGGTLIVRGPNKAAWIQWAQYFTRQTKEAPGFNPEHVYVLTRPFLANVLAPDFTNIKFEAATPLSEHFPMLGPVNRVAANVISSLTGGRFMPIPSMITVAERRQPVAASPVREHEQSFGQQTAELHWQR
jgi:SAM-dependent methyltransferase